MKARPSTAPSLASPLRRLFLQTSLAASIFLAGAARADQPASTPSPNYQAADRFAPANLRPFLYDTAVNPHWIGKTDGFWYSYRTSDGTNYYRVNPRLGTKERLFDRDKLSNLLSTRWSRSRSRRPCCPSSGWS